MYKNIESCTTMLLWKICVEGNNKPYVSLQVRVSTSCVPRSRNCISCVTGWPLQVHQLRPPVRKEFYQLRPGLWTPNMTSCVPRLVRNCISCIERYGCTKCSTIWRFSQFYCALFYTQLYAHIHIVEWYRQHSCYIMLLSNI